MGIEQVGQPDENPQLPTLTPNESALVYYALQGTIDQLTTSVGEEDERDADPLIFGVFQYTELRDKLFPPPFKEPTFRYVPDEE